MQLSRKCRICTQQLIARYGHGCTDFLNSDSRRSLRRCSTAILPAQVNTEIDFSQQVRAENNRNTARGTFTRSRLKVMRQHCRLLRRYFAAYQRCSAPRCRVPLPRQVFSVAATPRVLLPRRAASLPHVSRLPQSAGNAVSAICQALANAFSEKYRRRRRCMSPAIRHRAAVTRRMCMPRIAGACLMLPAPLPRSFQQPPTTLLTRQRIRFRPRPPRRRSFQRFRRRPA